jgi:hypothetical protein
MSRRDFGPTWLDAVSETSTRRFIQICDGRRPAVTCGGKMPATDRSPQYRIRSHEKRHERVVTEDMLEAVARQLETLTAVEQLFGEKNTLPR